VALPIVCPSMIEVVTIEKKDEINEYKKKEIQKKKQKKTKRRAYQCPPPFFKEYLC
jgi:hypothetical protein